MRSERIRISAAALGASAGHEVHAVRWDGGPDGAPIAVALHGLSGSHLNWSALGPHLVSAGVCRTLWAPDLAGFGHTPLGRRSAGVPANTRLAEAFVRRVASGPPVLLLGNSMGGLIALRLAATAPDLVARLVLVAPSAPHTMGAALDPRVTAQFAALLVPGIGERYVRRRVRRTTPREQTAETLALCTADPDRVDPGIVAAHVGMARHRRTLPYTERALLEAARSVVGTVVGPGRRSFGALADAVAAPTLVLQGERDRLVRAETSAALVRDRQGWELRRYPDLGHLPMLEDPVRVTEDIRGWAWPDRAGGRRRGAAARAGAGSAGDERAAAVGD